MSNEELVNLIHQGIDSADNLQLLYDQNKSFIRKIAKSFQGYVDMEDLMQEGFIGLYEAVKRYEGDKEVKFITYASFWIRQAMVRCVERQSNIVSAPRYLRTLISEYKKYISRFTVENGRAPSYDELLYYLCWDQNKLDLVQRYIYGMNQLQSLDSTLTEDSETTVSDTVPSGQNMEEEVIDQMMDQERSSLWDIVKDNTTDQENQVICLRYKENMTLKAIGEQLGIGDSAARTQESKALKKLRKSSVMRTLSEKFETAMAEAFHSGVSRFKTTWTSSTERAALKLEEMR